MCSVTPPLFPGTRRPSKALQYGPESRPQKAVPCYDFMEGSYSFNSPEPRGEEVHSISLPVFLTGSSRASQ